ncbi:ATP-grasp domain-containing protein [Yinghuangia sp. YIM S10712]|uniref:ATP-grasp domain-containing protein n=1 Tax=Yinghuangia sp. YIM S10712 TaxID=3436930 RepID=UPI003F53DE1C
MGSSTAREDRVLVLAPRSTDTDRRLAVAAYRRGLRVERARAWAVPEGVHAGRAHVYGGPLFADSVSRALALALLEIPDDWLAGLPRDLTARRVVATTLAQARRLRGSAFVKPPTDKTFPARVYQDGSELPGPDRADPDKPVLVCEVVRFTAEFRLFVLDGEVCGASRYAVEGDLAVAPLAACAEHREVAAFARDMCAATRDTLPSAAVVDVGRVDGRGWAVVEANAAWASGSYACDDDAVLDVVLRAAGPLGATAGRDRRFLRPAPHVER